MALSDQLTLITGKTRAQAIPLLASSEDASTGIIDNSTDFNKAYFENTGSLGTTGTVYAVLADLLRWLNAQDSTSDATIGSLLKIDQTNSRIGINKVAPTVALDLVGNALLKGDVTVHDSGDATIFMIDESDEVVGVGGAPNTANALLQVLGGDIDLDNTYSIRWKDSGGGFEDVLTYDANNNIVLKNTEAGGAGSRNKAGLRVDVASINPAMALIVDDQGQVGLGTPAPAGADSGVDAKLHVVGEEIRLEGTTPQLMLYGGVGDYWTFELDTNDLMIGYAGTDRFKVSTDGLYAVATADAVLHGYNALGTTFDALVFGDTTELMAYKTQAAPNILGSLKLKTKLDGPAGSYPNTTYGSLFIEGYGGHVGLWVNSLPTEALQMGDASLTEQIGIQIFDGGANKMGFLDLVEQNNHLYLYQDTNGILRTHTSKPGATGDTTGATTVISQTVVGGHATPTAAAGDKPSDVEGCLVLQYDSTGGTFRIYGRCGDGSWHYAALT